MNWKAKRDNRPFLLGVLLVILCLQNIVVVGLGGLDIKLFQVFGLVILLVSLGVRGSMWRVPSMGLCLLGLFVIGISFLDSFRFGFNAVLLNYAFFFVLVFAVYNLSVGFTLVQWERLIQVAALLVLGLVYVKMLLNSGAIKNFLMNPWAGHPDIETFFGGGVNLEATWLAMFGVFFKKDARGFAYLSGSMLISVVYASRAGVLLSVLSIIYVLAIRPRNRGLAIKLLGVGAIILIALLLLSVTDNPIVERFLSIGEDRGSQGRLNMWQFVLSAFEESPLLGCGAGNAIVHVEVISGMTFSEGNLHNYYFQTLLDFGLVGFSLFMITVFVFLRGAWIGKFSNPFEAFILCYLIVALIQFRGAEPLLAFMVAGYLSTSHNGASRVEHVLDPSRVGSGHETSSRKGLHADTVKGVEVSCLA